MRTIGSLKNEINNSKTISSRPQLNFFVNYPLMMRRFIVNLLDLLQVNYPLTYTARISSITPGEAPVLTPYDGVPGTGKEIMNNLLYQGETVNITYGYVSAGEYKVIADKPIFDDISNIDVVFQNNKYATGEAKTVVGFGKVMIEHDIDNKFEFTMITFNGMSGQINDGIIENCLIKITVPEVPVEPI